MLPPKKKLALKYKNDGRESPILSSTELLTSLEESRPPVAKRSSQGILPWLPKIVVELVPEEPQPSSSADVSNQFKMSFSQPSYSGSLPRSRGMMPSGSRAESITVPTSTNLKRRQMDTLIPTGCLLTWTKIIALPIDEFNRLMVEENFSEEQTAQLQELHKLRKRKNRVMFKFMKY
jgi:hypothetical protein